MADPTIKASGSAGTSGVSSDVQGSTPAPADATKKPEVSDPDKETWQIHPFGEFQFNCFDAGKGTDGLFSDNFAQLCDQKLLNLTLGFTTNVNSNKVRFEFGPWANLGDLSGGPQTNETRVDHLAVGIRGVLDWNRVWGLGALRLFGRADVNYGIGYAFGESTANPSIRKYPVDAFYNGGNFALEIIGVNAPAVEVGLKGVLGTYIADQSDFNVTGDYVGGAVEMRWGTHGGEKCTDVRHLHKSIKETQDRIAALRAENKDLIEKLKIIRDYIEKQPKHPHVGADLNRGRVLGHVVDSLIAKLGRPLSEESLNKIQNAVKEANKVKKDEEMPAAVAKATGIPEAEVGGYFTEAKAKVDADPDFWKLTQDVPVDAEAGAQGTPGPNETCVTGTYRDKLDERLIRLMKIADQLSDRNAELKGQLRRAIYLAGLSLGVEEIKDPTAFVDFLPIKGSKFRIARPTVDDIAKLKAWAESHKTNPANIDDPELMKIINARGKTENGQPRGVTVYTPAAAPKILGDIKNLGEYLNGKTDQLAAAEFRKLLLDKAGIEPEVVNEDDLKAKAAFQKVLLSKKLIIIGRTDTQGDLKMNMDLSQRRADWEKWLMVGLSGIDPARIEAKGIGPTVQEIPEQGLKGEELLEARFFNRAIDYILDKRKPEEVGTKVDAAGQKSEKGSDAEARKEAGLPEEKREKKPADKAAGAAAGAAAGGDKKKPNVFDTK